MSPRTLTLAFILVASLLIAVSWLLLLTMYIMLKKARTLGGAFSLLTLTCFNPPFFPLQFDSGAASPVNYWPTDEMGRMSWLTPAEEVKDRQLPPTQDYYNGEDDPSNPN